MTAEAEEGGLNNWRRRHSYPPGLATAHAGILLFLTFLFGVGQEEEGRGRARAGRPFAARHTTPASG